MKKSKITKIAVDRLQINEGQLDWLPRNPRQWTQTDIDRMVKSMEEDPDFAEDRPVLAVPLTGPGKNTTFVVFCHNLLTKAAQVRGDVALPTVIYQPESEEDRQTIRRRALKDNGSFGSWDTDILADEWEFETFELEDFGVPDYVTGNVANHVKTGLPEELAGKDLTPDDLPKIQGSDETARERIIICYRKEDEEGLAALLALEKIDKVVYDFKEGGLE